jgi:hypothetical protein
MKKKTKSSAVMGMLKKGYTVKEIKERIQVSESYIYAMKKLMNAGVEPFTPEEVGVSDETLIEVALTASQGKGKPKPGEFIEADTNVDAILNARASNYGSFLGLSQVTQRLKAVAHQFAGQNNKTFDADQAEALDLIFTKVGRILNGDPNHTDSWLDIAGYATLVADRLQGKSR